MTRPGEAHFALRFGATASRKDRAGGVRPRGGPLTRGVAKAVLPKKAARPAVSAGACGVRLTAGR